MENNNLHPFSLQFEHPADADYLSTAADSVRRCGRKMFPTYVHYKLFRIFFFFVLQSEIQDVWRLACTHAHVRDEKGGCTWAQKHGQNYLAQTRAHSKLVLGG